MHFTGTLLINKLPYIISDKDEITKMLKVILVFVK